MTAAAITLPPEPTPAERLKAARHKLGLSDREMAEALQLRGVNAKDDLRKMEDGMRKVTGPVLVAAEALVRLHGWEDMDLEGFAREVAEYPLADECPGIPANGALDEFVMAARRVVR